MGLLAYVGSWAAMIGGVWFLFSKAEDLLVSEKKEQISMWMVSITFRDSFNLWPHTFISVFDSIFGSQHFSWFCFKRSVIASFFSITIVTLIWIAFFEQQFLEFLELTGTTPYRNLYSIVVISAIILNTIPDYLSLLESRYMIKIMSNKKSNTTILILLLVDLIITGIIFLFFMFSGMNFLLFLTINDYYNYIENEGFLDHFISLSSSNFKAVIRFRPTTVGTIPDSIWFISTYFTSVWVWLYILTGFIMRSGRAFDIAVKVVKEYLNLEQAPLRTIGFLSVILVTVVYLVALPFVV